MGCGASSSAEPAPDHVIGARSGSGQSLWLRLLRLENVPDSDLSPFQNGDIVAKLVLTVPGGAPIEASSQKSSGQGAAHFPPVSARSHVKWDTMVHFELGAGRTWQSLKEDGATLVCRIFDTDIFTEDDLLGSVELSGATLHAKANTEEVVAAKVILGTGVKTENGDPCMIYFKVYGDVMGEAIDGLDKFFESKVALAGELSLLSDMQILWENFFANLFPYEGDRPCMTWIATIGGKKFVTALSRANLSTTFPSNMAPTMNALDAVKLMHRYSRGAADQATPVLQVGGLPVTATELQRRLEAVIAAELPEAEFKWTPSSRRLGVVGGMGPVAGAELAVDLSHRLAEARKGKDPKQRSGWQVYMLSDPAIETWKNETAEAWKSARSTVDMFAYLEREELAYTCIGSNTAHLMLQPSPPANLLSIFEAVALVIKTDFPGRKVALMCTSLSMKFADLGYGKTFRQHGLEFVEPSPEIQDKCMEGIKLVKNPTEGTTSFRKAVDCFIECIIWYSDRGVTVFALACTEIPVVLKESLIRSDVRLAGRDVQIVDSVAALGRSVTQTMLAEEAVED